jgi:RNA polymerase sigma-32 factor
MNDLEQQSLPGAQAVHARRKRQPPAAAERKADQSLASELLGASPMTTASEQPSSSSGSLAMYLSEINHYALLTVEEEQRLARRFKQGDLQAGHQLVTANLRFVVKISYEYRSYGIKMSDLIQEGNIGLMKAVQKFDADKQIRLISYAVWWIRAYIQNYILKSWSLVKLGTTQAQRKLFFSLARTRRELERLNHGEPQLTNIDEIARRLHVKPTEVREMEQRMGGRDLSLDAPMGEEGGNTHVDFVASGAALQDDEFAGKEEADLIGVHVREALLRLDPRERFIIEQRVMNEQPMTLKELGEHFGFSRERARQLEIRAKDKLKSELAALMAEVGQEEASPMQ